ncbi:AAA family ATPase [Photobacterium leiognathi]|uniref:AAA family ATPase n=1 Tax=Photobacterium leiognathi TaxID=553611 RepID=UPI00273835F1|nr:AAA family ATPase [Photobacterium leiognathi]
MFDPYHKLNDVVSWLSNPVKVSPKNFDFIVTSLRELLQVNMDDNAIFRRRNGNVTLSSKRGPVNIFELSDGYKSVISYTLDIMLCVHDKFNAISDAEGVVLIDEIENHLHPTWKVKIISLLRSVFPKINFIITTHDPLCLRGTQEGEVYVLNEDESGDVIAEPISVPRGMPIENLLLGSWFKMSSTLDEDTNSLFDKHRKLVHESIEDNAEEIKEIEDELESLMKYTSNSGLFGDYLNILKDAIKVQDTHDDVESIRAGISNRLSERFKK